jgi:hypothetical protein
MSDEEIEWSEADGRFIDFESEVLKLDDVLGGFHCKRCGDRLGLRLDPDPDSLAYQADCDPCDMHYRLQATHVRASAYEKGL